MRLAASNLAAAQNVALYTVPADRRAVLTVSLCNRAAASAKVRLALTAGGDPTDADWLEYDASLTGSGVLERTGLALAAGQKVFVRSDTATVSASAYGVEETV